MPTIERAPAESVARCNTPGAQHATPAERTQHHAQQGAQHSPAPDVKTLATQALGRIERRNRARNPVTHAPRGQVRPAHSIRGELRPGLGHPAMRALAACCLCLSMTACGLEAIPAKVELEKSPERCASDDYIVVERYESFYGDREYYCVPRPLNQGEE